MGVFTYAHGIFLYSSLCRFRWYITCPCTNFFQFIFSSERLWCKCKFSFYFIFVIRCACCSIIIVVEATIPNKVCEWQCCHCWTEGYHVASIIPWTRLHFSPLRWFPCIHVFMHASRNVVNTVWDMGKMRTCGQVNCGPSTGSSFSQVRCQLPPPACPGEG